MSVDTRADRIEATHAIGTIFRRKHLFAIKIDARGHCRAWQRTFQLLRASIRRRARFEPTTASRASALLGLLRRAPSTLHVRLFLLVRAAAARFATTADREQTRVCRPDNREKETAAS